MFQWIQFDATVAEAEELLITEFYVWEHISGTHDISTEEYHVPSRIQEHIDYITPRTRLRQRSVRAAKNVKLGNGLGVKPLITQLPGFPHPNSSTCDIYVTADCTRGMFSRASTRSICSNRRCLVQYDIPDATTAAAGNQLGIFESLDVHYSRKDLDIYFSTLYP